MTKYTIQILEVYTPKWGFTRHMKVKRSDGKSGISWDILQQLKNEYLGPDVMAVEIFPPEHEVVNDLNMRHLWEIPLGQIPVTLNGDKNG